MTVPPPDNIHDHRPPTSTSTITTHQLNTTSQPNPTTTPSSSSSTSKPLPTISKRKKSTSAGATTKNGGDSGEGAGGGKQDEKDKAAKKTRQSQSCDACRVRKVKCVPLVPLPLGEDGKPIVPKDGEDEGDGGGGPPKKGSKPCKSCSTLGLPCTYDYVPRKRGPPNMYLKRLQAEQQQQLLLQQQLQDPEQSHPFGSPAQLSFDPFTSPIASIPHPSLPHPHSHPNAHSGPGPHRPQHARAGSSSAYTQGGGGYPYYTPTFEESKYDPSENSRGVGGLGKRDRHKRESSAAGADGRDEDFMEMARKSMDDAMGGGVKGLVAAAAGGSAGPFNEVPYVQPGQGSLMGAPSRTSYPGLGRTLTGLSTATGGGTKAVPGPDISLPALTPMSGPSPSGTTLSSLFRYAGAGGGAEGQSPLGLGMGGTGLTPSFDDGSSFLRSTAVEGGGPRDDLEAGAPWDPSETERMLVRNLPPVSGSSGVGGQNTGYYSSPSDLLEDSQARERRLLPGEASAFPTGSADGTVGERTRTASMSQANVAALSRYPPPGRADSFPNLESPNQASMWAATGNFSSSGMGGPGVPNPLPLSKAAMPAAAVFPQASPITNLLHHSPFSTHSQNPGNPLEAYLPRPLLHLIIGLFFDYVYPLTPCLHKPTFYNDLVSKREERPGEEEWTMLVLSVVCSTLVQMPRAFVPLTRKEVRELAQRCYEGTRRWVINGYKEVTVYTVIISQLVTVYNYCRGEGAACHASFLESQALATILRLHEEESYTFLDPIERELRRRVFFLMFQADKSESVLLGRPIRMREEDCYSLRLPEELDDEFITKDAYLAQPLGVPSIIAGFNAGTRIMSVIGRTMIKHRECKRDPPAGARLQTCLDEVSRLLDEVMSVMDNCPPALRLKSGVDSRAQSPAGGWDTEASAQLQALFFDPTADRRKAKDAFLVQQGNIYVTQQLARFVLLQFRSDLLALRPGGASAQASGFGDPGWQSVGGIPIGGGGAFGGSLASMGTTEQPRIDREGLCYDLLTILHSLPIQTIPVNGPSLVHKVRYIAASLLDAVQAKPVEGDPPANGVRAGTDASDGSANVLRAQSYLLDFLSILGEIEKNYLLEDEDEAVGVAMV